MVSVMPLGGSRLVGLLCLLGYVTAQMGDEPPEGVRKVTIPPLITMEPPETLVFREEESIEMPCVASGQPEPSYRWEMNGKDFDPSGNDGRIAIQPGVGTLIFARPIERDEAIYQCIAENEVGIAVTVKVNLRVGILDPFIARPTRVHYPRLGQRLTLKCTPPRSYPQPEIFWATVQEGAGFVPIDLTARVSVDPVGNLHIANVVPADRQDGRQYVCIVQNTVMRQTQHGDYQRIEPQGGEPSRMPPAILWQDPTQQVTLRGDTIKIKCIFSGNPTPRVTWERQGKPMPSGYRVESFGAELVIDNVQERDAGKYECQGYNEESTIPIRRSFDVKVEARPYWIDKPESFDAADNDTAVFYCRAGGIPEPKIIWYLNSVLISEIPSDPRRRVEKHKLTFENVTKNDAMVVQCNATNSHGYIFTNAYLNVLAEPPVITEAPLEGQLAAESQSVTLRCSVFGSPKPLVVWKKGDEQLTGGRFKVLENGHLQIMDVSLVDAGRYTCKATNKFDTVSKTGSLIVRRKTRIITAPLNVMVYEDTEAKFTCTGTTDPEEVSNLKIDWKKDGEIIDYSMAQRMFKNVMDNSLTISGTITLDTGKYTCVASNGLDEDEASAQLVVQGLPDPPMNVYVWCRDKERIAEIEWHPGKENYAPILNFIIQFNTTFAPDTWINIETNVSQSARKWVVEMSPYGNYTFRVLARNKIGLSPPSLHTRNICRTDDDVPYKNPENVIAEGDEPNNLVIYWTPMPEIEHNGRDFKYIVWWRKNETGATAYSYTIQRPEVYHHVVAEPVPTFTAYQVYVKAKNSQGDCRESPNIVIGWSGEDVPLVYPTDLTVVSDSIKGTTATLQWTHVNTDADQILGHFRGYRIQFWKQDDGPETMREHDLIMIKASQYPRPRFKREVDSQLVTYQLDSLPPYAKIIVQVRVLNKYYAGPPSQPNVEFTTKEGKPGPPVSFTVIARGATHFELEWEKPIEPNGILVGYNISYQSITGLNLGRLQYREPIEDPEIVRARLTGLHPNMDYRIFLSASTQVGKGEPIFLDAQTTHAGSPSPPTFDIMELGEQYVIVQWEPSRSSNPGSVFYIQYRERSNYHWMYGNDEALHYKANISDLDPGTTYQIRVVAKNGEGYESPSEYQEFLTGGLGPGRIKLSTSGWFYGIFISILIIIILMVLFMVKKKYRDVWWEHIENEIEEQVRQLQAEEATRQMGITNMYAQTGSQEVLAPADMSHASLHDSFKPPLPDDDDDDDDDDDKSFDTEEEDEEDYGKQQRVPQTGYAPQGYQQQQPAYPGYTQQAQGYHTGMAQGQGYHAGYSQNQAHLDEPRSGQGASFI